jgi:hypothetical protein
MNKNIGTVEFLGEQCSVELTEYVSGGKAILLKCEDGSPMASATVWVNELKQDEIAVKDYSENEGLYEVLLKAGIVAPYHRLVPSGYVQLKVTRLL